MLIRVLVVMAFVTMAIIVITVALFEVTAELLVAARGTEDRLSGGG